MSKVQRPKVGDRVLFAQLGTLVRLRRGRPVVQFDGAEVAICPWRLLSPVTAPRRKAKASKKGKRDE